MRRQTRLTRQWSWCTKARLAISGPSNGCCTMPNPSTQAIVIVSGGFFSDYVRADVEVEM